MLRLFLQDICKIRMPPASLQIDTRQTANTFFFEHNRGLDSTEMITDVRAVCDHDQFEKYDCDQKLAINDHISKNSAIRVFFTNNLIDKHILCLLEEVGLYFYHATDLAL